MHVLGRHRQERSQEGERLVSTIGTFEEDDNEPERPRPEGVPRGTRYVPVRVREVRDGELRLPMNPEVRAGASMRWSHGVARSVKPGGRARRPGASPAPLD
jgi:hypothetical protein